MQLKIAGDPAKCNKSEKACSVNTRQTSCQGGWLVPCTPQHERAGRVKIRNRPC